MIHPNITKLAGNILDYSIKVNAGEKVFIDFKGEAVEGLASELIRLITERGAVPFWYFNDPPLFRAFLQNTNSKQMRGFTDIHLSLMKQMDCYIGIDGCGNIFDLAELPETGKELLQDVFDREVVFQERVPNTRWCKLRYPNDSMAQLSRMPTAEFQEHFFKVCSLDYAALSKRMDPLKSLMEKTDRVRILGPGTDLSFSIRDIPVVKCSGEMNLPDGEIYTAPVRDSIEGEILFNTPSVYQGELFEGMRLKFSKGKILEASCTGKTERMNELIFSDEGSCYTGEFALGVNPQILHPMRDTLFDEKIYGSFHLTPGNAYDDADNGNRSSIHWDMIKIQRPEYGGGEIWFDGLLVRKDGEFIPDELLGLNR